MAASKAMYNEHKNSQDFDLLRTLLIQESKAITQNFGQDTLKVNGLCRLRAYKERVVCLLVWCYFLVKNSVAHLLK